LPILQIWLIFQLEKKYIEQAYTLSKNQTFEKMLKKFFLTLNLLLLFILNFAYAQSKDGWNIYTSFKDVRGVGISGNTVWGAATGGLFSFDINSLSTTKYTTLQGLLSNQLTSVLVDNSGNVWSGTSDGAINVYYPSVGNFRVISDILNSTESIKNINGFFQYGNNLFIATEFSIIKFDISRFQFVDQPYIYLGPLVPVKTPVYETVVINDTIWAATKNGIAYANINNYLPLQSSWSNYTTANSILQKNKINTAVYFANRMFFGTDSTMVYHDGNSLQPYTPLHNGTPIADRVNHMAVSNSSMYFSTYMFSNNIFKVNSSNLNSAELVYSGLEVNSLKVMPNGDLVIGTSNKGINLIKNNTNNFIIPNGPFSNIFYHIALDNKGNVWAVSGSTGADWTTNSGVYKFDGTLWKNYLYADYPVMANGCCGWVQVYPSEYDDNVWVSGLGNGLLKINGENVERYHDENSILNAYGGPGFVVVLGVKEDNARNLWVLNSLTPYPIVNFTTLDTFELPVGNSSNTAVVFLAIDRYNTKWMTLGNEGSLKGVMYFNESVPTGGVIMPDQLGADIRSVNDIIVENNGEVWVATDNGVVIISDPYQVIQNPNSVPYTQKMRIIENGISTPLTENVNTLRSDALNNKWLGTNSNGVLNVSPDGSTLLNQFTVKNSPLPDNKINCIAIDRKSGLVYMGTQNGMVSFKTIAIEPVEDFDKITAGPSPFLIPNDKLLRIDGLVENSSIKILSISGTLIAEFETPGGRVANWDGRDLNGNYVSSGIYIIVGYDEDGSKVGTGKVAVVRK
jgi:ligand-binding sensor domain-containing protein